jgi:dTDP-glucose 4,6-dehydratase
MKQGKNGEIYNIGGSGEMENIKLVEMICDILDDIGRLPDCPSRRDLIKFVKDRPGHDQRYAIDYSKLEKALDWRPEVSLEKGIRKTIDWYLKNRQWVERVKSGEYQTWIKTHYG